MEIPMEAMRKVLERLPRADTGVAPELLAWPLAAGTGLAARVECLGLRQGRLELRTRDASARRQVESVAAELRRDLNRMLGGDKVQRIVFP